MYIPSPQSHIIRGSDSAGVEDTPGAPPHTRFSAPSWHRGGYINKLLCHGAGCMPGSRTKKHEKWHAPLILAKTVRTLCVSPFTLLPLLPQMCSPYLRWQGPRKKAPWTKESRNEGCSREWPDMPLCLGEQELNFCRIKPQKLGVVCFTTAVTIQSA